MYFNTKHSLRDNKVPDGSTVGLTDGIGVGVARSQYENQNNMIK